MELAAFSDRGIGTRERLEDFAANRIITTPGGLQLQLVMVCDGAGGGEAGEMAARLTSRTIFEYLEITPEKSVPKLLIKAVEQANKAVYSELRGTGTSTVALAAVHLNDDSAPFGRLYVANVGNSRIYLMRAGHLARLNIDHTLENEYVFAGQMSAEEAKQLEDPEYVTRAIGIGAQVSVDIGFYVERGKNFVNSRRAFRIGQKGMVLQEGDTVFAASDGLFPYVHDEEFLTHALDDDVERATRTLLKYAADRGPEDNTALSMLFVPSRNRKMVQTGPRLSGKQRAGIAVFLLAIILLIGFLGIQAAAGANQQVAFVANQTLVQQLILESSYTPTPTPLPPTATPTQPIIIGQVGNRYSQSQAGLPVFTGRFIDPLTPSEINYISVAGLDVLSSGTTNNPANLYLQPSTSIRLNQVIDTPGKEHIDMVLGHTGEVFVNMGDYKNGGISIAMEQNTDITLNSESACMSAKQIPADPNKSTDTDKVILACYGGGACGFQFPGADSMSVAPGQQALIDINNQKLISTTPLTQADVDGYRQTIWTLTQNPAQLSCLSNWLDEDKDGINYPLDQCPTDFGSVAAQGCPDKDGDGVPDTADQCPIDVGPASNNGCPLPDVDGDGLAGAADACPFDKGPASNDGCPIEGDIATQHAQTLTATFSVLAATPTQSATPSPTATQSLTPSPMPTATLTPTATLIPLPIAVDDTYSTLNNEALTISPPGVILNDTLNGAVLGTTSGTTAYGGSYTLTSDGGFIYSPTSQNVPQDSFTYTLTNEVGSDSATVIINLVKPPPPPLHADFTWVVAAAPLTINFDASTSTLQANINSYTWDFGDGGAGNGVNTSHLYTGPGDYGVTLTIHGAGGTTDSKFQVVHVPTPPPTACFNTTPANNPTIVSGGTVSFTSCSTPTGSITGYGWNFGDGNTAVGATTSHTFPVNNGAAPVTYTVVLTLNGNPALTISHTVTVSPEVAQACFNPPTAVITVGGTVQFTSCSSGATSYTWDFGDGSPLDTTSGAIVTHKYTVASAPTFTVKLTINGIPALNITHTVTVNSLIACFNTVPPNNPTVASGTIVSFTNCSTAGVTYSWDFGDGSAIVTTANATHLFTNPGATPIIYKVTLTITNSTGSTASVFHTVTVNVPLPPVPNAVNDGAAPPGTTPYNVAMNSQLVVNIANGVLSNDTPNGGTLSIVTAPIHDSAFNLNLDGSFTYTPVTGYAGPDTFTYRLTNTGGNDTAISHICVYPLTKADRYAVAFPGPLVLPLNIGPAANDTFPPPPAVIVPNFPAMTTQGGTLGVAGTTLTYTPPNPFPVALPATDTFSYSLSVNGCASPLTLDTIDVMTANNPPVADNDGIPGSYTVSEGVTVSIPAATGVLANDVDPDGNTIIAVLDTTTANGTLTLHSDGSFTYVSNTPFTGPDTFTYHATDGDLDLAIVTVTMNVQADNAPNAVADSYNMAIGTTSLTVNAATGVLSNDSDPDGNPMTAVQVGVASAGTATLNPDGSFVYTPPINPVGPYTFTYHATDGGTNSADVLVTINMVANTPPTAQDQTYTLNEDTPVIFDAFTGLLVGAADADGNPLTVALPLPTTTTQGGTLTVNTDGSFVYVPKADFNGQDTFTYFANDGLVNSNQATVFLNVTAVDDAPVANSNIYSVPLNTTLTVNTVQGVLTDDTDVDGPLPLTVTLPLPSVTTQGGTLTFNANGSFTYMPPSPIFTGQDTFDYQATDGTLNSNFGLVTINVGINSAPTAANDTFGTSLNNPLTITAPGILGNDTDLDANTLTVDLATVSALTLTPANGGVNGTLVMNASGDGGFTYTPPTGYTGSVTFTYRANDGAVDSTTAATVTINVGINSPPNAVGDAFTMTDTTPLLVPAPGVLGNDTDPDTGTILTVDVASVSVLTLTPANGAVNGTLVMTANGGFTYTAPVGYKGIVSFTYQANDGTVDSTPATVSIGVNTLPPKPHTVAISVPAPPPATRCTDTNFENPGQIRSHFTNDIDRANLFCRLIAAGGSYMYWFGSPITNAGNVGAQNVLDLGLVAAVDVFSMTDVSGFVGDVDICLKGSGYMIYMNVLGQPRVPQLWSAWTTNAFPGYTCTTLYAPGTVILVANKPK